MTRVADIAEMGGQSRSLLRQVLAEGTVTVDPDRFVGAVGANHHGQLAVASVAKSGVALDAVLKPRGAKEALAVAIGERLGMADQLPVVGLRDDNVAAIQLLVGRSFAHLEHTPAMRQFDAAAGARMATRVRAFDYVIANWDRNRGNVLDGVALLDHEFIGFARDADPLVPTVTTFLHGTPVGPRAAQLEQMHLDDALRDAWRGRQLLDLQPMLERAIDTSIRTPGFGIHYLEQAQARLDHLVDQGVVMIRNTSR